MDKYNNRRNLFKQLLDDPKILSMVVAPDALAARIAEQEGFKAVFVAGYATAASKLALPDRGILDFGQMLENLKEIVDAVNIPVFVDGDTGYGDSENVARTVRAYESAGASGIFLEDQVWPKRCGHMDGKSVVPAEELAKKIKTATKARKYSNFQIMSRTDSRQMYGLQEAIDRSKLYKQSGADMVFIEDPQSKDELKRIVEEFPDTPLMANMIEDGATPMMSAKELEDMGYSLVVHPTALTYADAYAQRAVLEDINKTGQTSTTKKHMVTFTDFNNMVGLDDLNELENKYSTFNMTKMLNDLSL